MTRREPAAVFVIKLQAAPGTDSIRALRALLKILVRRFGLRCLSAREEQPTSSAAHREEIMREELCK
jgi:hypothetical protein